MSNLKELVASLFQDEDNAQDETSSNSSLDEIEMRLQRFRDQGYRIMYEGPTMRTKGYSGFVDEIARNNASKTGPKPVYSPPSRETISKKIADDYERYVIKYHSSFGCDLLDFSETPSTKAENMDVIFEVMSVPQSPQSLDLRLSSDDEEEFLDQVESPTQKFIPRKKHKPTIENVILKSCLRSIQDKKEANKKNRRVVITENVCKLPFDHEVIVKNSGDYVRELESQHGQLVNLTIEEEPSQKYGNRDNLVQLPHRNSRVRLSKRIEPSLIEGVSLEDEVVHNYVRLLLDLDQKKHLRISKWLICDSLLERLNAGALQNAVVSRIEFPTMPRCLIEEAMDPRKGMFPKEFCQIFVALGFDILLYHHDEKTKAHLRFITQLCGWLADINGERVDYVKDVHLDDGTFAQLPSFFYRYTSVVVITIPEVGDFSRDYADYNNKLRVLARKIRDSGVSTTISILDWAEKVKNSEDRLAMNTVEGRIALLVQEMSVEYGVLVSHY